MTENSAIDKRDKMLDGVASAIERVCDMCFEGYPKMHQASDSVGDQMLSAGVSPLRAHAALIREAQKGASDGQS